jgi:glycerol-3-phosphate dehydrogenase (NAD(P)+)
MSRIAVIGSGSWGTALAIVLARRGDHRITLWAHTEATVRSIEDQRQNTRYLPEIAIPRSISATSHLQEAVSNAEIVVLAVPSEYLRHVVTAMTPAVAGQTFVSATKGLEDGTCRRMSEVIVDALRQQGRAVPLAVLSGPSFAQEVAVGNPTAITIASQDPAVAAALQRAFAGPTFRLYTNDDLVGVELGGALKNVIAIAAGATFGLGLGHNSMAALVTRGIAEITRLAVACGGQRETLAGLAGLGDLVLTCTGALSRNRHVGMELGRGSRLSDILLAMNGKVAEGIRTTQAALALAGRCQIEMPIVEKVADLLAERLSAREAMRQLMARPGRDESDGSVIA